MKLQQEGAPTGVPEAIQVGDAESSDIARHREWEYAEPAVWTERMLAALGRGVKGGKWFSLMDKVYAARTLSAAWQRVKRNGGSAGVDRQTIRAFEARAERYLGELAEELHCGRYRPQPVKRTWIEKPGGREKRPLGIPTVKDRIVQTAVKMVLEPIFEATFAEQSYGFRPRRGCKDALRRVQGLLNEGKVWVVDADLEGYFDSIPHADLMARIEEQVADGRVLSLLQSYLKQGVMEGLEAWEPEAGTPQGAVISPLLANVYLNPLDQEMARGGWQMVRYADDFVVLCGSQSQAEAALVALRQWATANGLSLHTEKTRVVDAREGRFEFLGYVFTRGKRWPRKRSTQRFRSAIRRKTRRSHGQSLEEIIRTINPIIRGWYEYYKHSSRTTFDPLDGYVRMRLRSILRKRRGGKGRGRGADHQRWPNHFFVEQGLFTMTRAHRSACQPR